MREGRGIVRAVGLALLGVGVVSQIATLTTRVPAWGSTEWEVAYFGESSSTLVIALMGLAILAGLAVDRGERWTKIGLAVVFAFLGSWALVGAMVVALDMPLVWQAARTAGSTARAAGFKIVTVKAIALCGWYAVWLFVAAGLMVRSTVTKSR